MHSSPFAKVFLRFFSAFFALGVWRRFGQQRNKIISNYIIELKKRHTMIYIRVFYLRAAVKATPVALLFAIFLAIIFTIFIFVR